MLEAYTHQTFIDVIPREVIEAREALVERSKDDPEFREKAIALASRGAVEFTTYFCWTGQWVRQLAMSLGTI